MVGCISLYSDIVIFSLLWYLVTLIVFDSVQQCASVHFSSSRECRNSGDRLAQDECCTRFRSAKDLGDPHNVDSPWISWEIDGRIAES
jgi:hypothetical protein